MLAIDPDPIKEARWSPGFNRDDPLAVGCQFCLPLWEGGGVKVWDVSGRWHVGTLTNGPTWKGSQLGTVLDFGALGDEHVVLPSIAYSRNYYGTAAFWVQFATLTTSQTILGSTGYTFDYHIGWYTNPFWAYRVGGSYATVAHTPTLNRWTHCAYVRDPTNVYLYIDGAYIGSNSLNVAAESTIDVLGLDLGTNGLDLRGKLGSVALWNRALNAQEVRRLYHDRWCLIRQPRLSRRTREIAAAGPTVPLMDQYYRRMRAA